MRLTISMLLIAVLAVACLANEDLSVVPPTPDDVIFQPGGTKNLKR